VRAKNMQYGMWWDEVGQHNAFKYIKYISTNVIKAMERTFGA
jgi:hypothetical protein